MKLSSIHTDRVDDAELSVVVTEGILNDLMSSGMTKLQAWLANRGSGLPPNVRKLVEKAKAVKASLLSEEDEAREWWTALFAAFGLKEEQYSEVYKKVISQIKPRIDLSQEDSESRLKSAETEREKRKKEGGVFSNAMKSVLSQKNDKSSKGGTKRKPKVVPSGDEEDEGI